MDDRELEARLRMHLHGRLDDLEAPRALRMVVEESLRSPARPVVVRGFRVRPRMQLGFSLAAAGVVVLALAIAAGLGLNGGIGGRSATPSPTGDGSSSVPTERDFLVLPPTSGLPDKTVALAAGDVLSARLRALGIGNFTLAQGGAMTFTILDGTGPGDDTIRAVLSATGAVAFVPLPPGDYGDNMGSGQLQAVIGQPLPKPEAALFGREGVVSVAFENTSPGSPAPLDIKLTPSASQALAEWSTGHVGDILAILVDGKVVMLPAIREPLTGGTMSVQSGGDNPPFPGEGIAVLIGGELPEAWRGAAVPVVIGRDGALARALAATAGGTVHDAELSGELSGGRWRAVWNVTVENAGCSDVTSCAYASPVVKIDAVSGSVIGFTAPSQ